MKRHSKWVTTVAGYTEENSLHSECSTMDRGAQDHGDAQDQMASDAVFEILLVDLENRILERVCT
jgi:hypothetical protein